MCRPNTPGSNLGKNVMVLAMPLSHELFFRRGQCAEQPCSQGVAKLLC